MGAGGSSGSELCRQISDLEPSRILLEKMNQVFIVFEEMKKKKQKRLPFEALLVSAGDYEFNIEIFKKHKGMVYSMLPISMSQLLKNPIAGIKQLTSNF